MIRDRPEASNNAIDAGQVEACWRPHVGGRRSRREQIEQTISQAIFLPIRPRTDINTSRSPGYCMRGVLAWDLIYARQIVLADRRH
jgi:hypothetical protein